MTRHELRAQVPMILAAVVWLLPALPALAAPTDDDFDEDEDFVVEESVADPIEPVNRAVYVFNDKLYFWVLKPVATGYEKVVPERARRGIDNAFDNLRMPKRAVNCLLQGKVKGAGTEVARFLVNSTAGVAGLMDVAESQCDLKPVPEDTGQTLGSYGMGHGVYLTLPVLGPSSARDAVGLVGDTLLDPLFFLSMDKYVRLGVRTEETVNGTSLRLGEYEKTKDMALDHYVSLKDMYIQYRDAKTEE